MKVEVKDFKYRFSHGHSPRGKGEWFFHTRLNAEEHYVYNGYYTEAKKRAERWARSKGFREIEVGP